MRVASTPMRYLRKNGQNRRRPKHPTRRAIARLLLFIVALGIVICVLMKLGVIREPERELYFVAGLTPSPDSYRYHYHHHDQCLSLITEPPALNSMAWNALLTTKIAPQKILGVTS